MNTINFKQESKLLSDFISSIWAGTQGEWFELMVEEVFMRGVIDSRYSSTQYINFAAAKEMGKDYADFVDHRRALMATNSNYVCGSDYDSLCLIYRFIDDVSTRIFDASWKGISSNTIDVLAQEMKTKYGQVMMGLTPLTYVEDEMHGYLMADYTGFKGSHERTYSVLEKLAPKYAKGSVESVGIEFYEWLVNGIYQHGMSCASNNNTADILNVLVPFYKKYIDEPLMIGNGEELLIELSKSKYFSFLMGFESIKFPTQSDLDAELKLEAEALERIANETPEQKAKRLSDHEAWMDNMLSGIINFDDELAIKEKQSELEKTNKLMADTEILLPIGV